MSAIVETKRKAGLFDGNVALEYYQVLSEASCRLIKAEILHKDKSQEKGRQSVESVYI